ncbi:MAG: hypothetical protein JSW25_03595 [Thermoplasmata archaeon]|nr:MAG: hypothetical protein JSW25_03595 [Thermoplasmata archaeon]
MIEWFSSKMVTSITVLVIAASFTGLFSMQADYYRTQELEDLANAITDLVTEVELLDGQVWVEVNWTVSARSHGLPREFHGKPYVIRFTPERPYVAWQGQVVPGRFFPSDIRLIGSDGEETHLLEIASAIGFTLESSPIWTEWGLEHALSIRPVLMP